VCITVVVLFAVGGIGGVLVVFTVVALYTSSVVDDVSMSSFY